MSDSPRSLDLPKRVSLSEQAAAAIRKAIETGMWKEYLPSERRLCQLFQISRPTIRTAVHMLAREGWLDIRQGRRNRLLKQRARPAESKSRLVVLVTTEPVSHMTLTAYQGIAEMRAHLADHGFTTEILVCDPHSVRVQRRQTETFVRQNRVLCCVLVSVSRELQEWFIAHSIPALVLGSCHASVKLPSLDVDYRAVCRHAAGVFRAKGHRRIAFLVPNSGLAGDLVSEQGFREGLQQPAQSKEVQAIVVRHDGLAQHLASKLDALFNSPNAPTALLVSRPQHMLFVIMYLLKRGRVVPETVSLIARDHDHLFEGAVAHYAIAGDTFAHRLSRLMIQMVSQRGLLPEPSLIFPEYIAGNTVKMLE